MSTFTDIKAKQTGGRTKQWWRNKLRTALNTYVAPQVGRMVFFDYPNPKFKEKMFHWDAFPLVYIMNEDAEHFWGANLHYVMPQERVAMGEALLAGNSISSDLFALTVHKYLRNRVRGALLDIPESDWADIGLMPLEQFYVTINGRDRPMPTQLALKR